MTLPPSVPSPQNVMLAGFFDFGDVDKNFWAVLGASALVVVGFVLLGLTRNKPTYRFLVIQAFFELLSFPLIKKLTAVLSCTSAKVWKQDGSGRALRFCGENVTSDGQCMDNNPEVECWTSDEHRGYLVVVIVLLVPYYLACLKLQATGFKRQSVVAVDGAWAVIVAQSKFVLGIIASSFGDCYPIVIVLSVELVVLSQLAMHQHGIVYSSVHSLNSIRLGGLLCAAVNGMYALFVLYYYRDDPAGAPPCSTVGGGSGSGPALQLVSDYSTFVALLAVNALAIGLGFVWHRRVRTRWLADEHKKDYNDLNSINSHRMAKEVDFPIVKARLTALTDRPCADELRTREDPFEFDLYTREQESGQQLEKATLDLVLNHEALSGHGVRLLNINVQEPSGVMALGALARMNGVRSRKACCRKKNVSASKASIVGATFSSPFRDVEKVATTALWASRVFALAVLAQNKDALEHVQQKLKEELQAEFEQLNSLVEQDEKILGSLSHLRNRKAFMFAAVAQKDDTARFASETLRADPQFKQWTDLIKARSRSVGNKEMERIASGEHAEANRGTRACDALSICLSKARARLQGQQVAVRQGTKTILITGSSGALGTALAEYLVKESDEYCIVCLDRVAPKETMLRNSQVYYKKGDFGDRAVLERLSRRIGQIDVCVHLAAVTAMNALPPEAQGEQERGDSSFVVNVAGTHTLLAHLRDKGTCVSSPGLFCLSCRRL